MKQIYALHKRFLADVDRFMKREDNMEKMMVFAMNYLSLRQVHSDEISNRDLMEVVRKVSFIDYEIPELYQKFMDELTNQQFIFRIKRVKYVRNTKDSVMIVSSPLMMKIGKYLMADQSSGVMLMNDEDNENKEVNEQPVSDPAPVNTQHEITEESSEDSIEYLEQIWDDSEKRLIWLLKNMKYTNRKYGYSQTNGFTPEEIGMKLNKSSLTVKHYVRRYLTQSNDKIAE